MQTTWMSSEIPALALIGLGLVQCFAGYRLLKLVLSLTGFLLGAMVVGTAATTITENGFAILACVLLGGVVGGVLMFVFYSAGIFVLGGALGYVAGSAWFGASAQPVQPALLGLLSIVGGILSLWLQRFMLKAATAFAGAWAALSGAAFFFLDGVDPTRFDWLLHLEPRLRFGWLAGWTLLGALGFALQSSTRGKTE